MLSKKKGNMFDKKFTIKDVFSFIRLGIMCIILLLIWKVFIFVMQSFDNFIPSMDYETVFIDKGRIVHDVDTIIQWYERITQVEAKPETVYTVIYPSQKDEMVNYVLARGNKIRIRTQFCGDTVGKELVFPYYKYFQFVPPRNMIYYPDYWDWEKLTLSADYSNLGILKLQAESHLWFNPIKLSIGGYISNKDIGILIKKKLW